MKQFPIDIEGNRERALAEQLRVQLGCFAARDKIDAPIRADEMLIEVPREKLREIMGLALEALLDRQRNET